MTGRGTDREEGPGSELGEPPAALCCAGITGAVVSERRSHSLSWGGHPCNGATPPVVLLDSHSPGALGTGEIY